MKKLLLPLTAGAALTAALSLTLPLLTRDSAAQPGPSTGIGPDTSVTHTNVMGWTDDYFPGEVYFFSVRAFEVSGTITNQPRANATTNEIAYGAVLAGVPNGTWALSVAATGPGGFSGWSTNHVVKWWGGWAACSWGAF